MKDPALYFNFDYNVTKYMLNCLILLTWKLKKIS